MLLAVLLFFGGTPAVPAWSPAPEGLTARSAAPAHDLVTVRPAVPRGPATTPVPWALTPSSATVAPAPKWWRAELPGAALRAVALPTSRSTRAPPAFAS